jgi:hypothetical protein
VTLVYFVIGASGTCVLLCIVGVIVLCVFIRNEPNYGPVKLVERETFKL